MNSALRRNFTESPLQEFVIPALGKGTMSENWEKKYMSWYLRQLKLRFGNNTHRYSRQHPRRIGRNVGLSAGFKILWDIIITYFKINSTSPKSQNFVSTFYISLV